MHPFAAIDSPIRNVWHLGPIPIRAYALCIVAGILLALWLTNRRWRERGGSEDDIWDIAGWAIVFGIIGGRLYHVITDPELYFLGRPGTSPINALKIWDGGLGIWGAIALGTLGAWVGCRRKGASLVSFADAAVPGVIFAQAIGRWGNYFNNELYGGPTSLPWGLKVHCMDIATGSVGAFGSADGGQLCNSAGVVPGLFQPTFLYESLWDLALGFLLLYIDRKYRVGRGNLMATYVMGYTVGRVWIEALREDHANHILGLRLNIWTCIIVFALGLAWFVKHRGWTAQRPDTPYPGTHPAAKVGAVQRNADTDAPPPDGNATAARAAVSDGSVSDGSVSDGDGSELDADG